MIIKIIVFVIATELLLRFSSDFKLGVSSLIIEPIIKPYLFKKAVNEKYSGRLLNILKKKLDRYSAMYCITHYIEIENHRLIEKEVNSLHYEYDSSHKIIQREFDYTYFDTIYRVYELLKSSKFEVDNDLHSNLRVLIKELRNELKAIKENIKSDNVEDDVIQDEMNYIMEIKKLRESI